MNLIQEQVFTTIAEEVGPVNFDSGSSLDSLGIDSLDFIALIQALERDFSIKIPEASIVKLNTVGHIVKLVEELQNAHVSA